MPLCDFAQCQHCDLPLSTLCSKASCTNPLHHLCFEAWRTARGVPEQDGNARYCHGCSAELFVPLSQMVTYDEEDARLRAAQSASESITHAGGQLSTDIEHMERTAGAHPHL